MDEMTTARFRPPRTGSGQQREQPADLLLAAGEVGDPGGQRARHDRHRPLSGPGAARGFRARARTGRAVRAVRAVRGGLGAVRQHRLVRGAQNGTRLDAQLLHQRRPRALVHLESLGGPAGRMQREHQLGVEPLAQGMVPGQGPQIRDDTLVPAEPLLRLDPVLRGEPTQFLEPARLVGQPALRRQPLEGAAPPQVERVPQPLARRGPVLGGQRTFGPQPQRREPQVVEL